MPKNIPQEVVLNFSELNINPSILKAVEESGYTSPTPIQQKTIPLLLEKFDIIGLAQTGTGKTAAFAIPALCQIADKTNIKLPNILVITPTRELAIQVSNNFEKYAKYLPHLKTATIYGGSSYTPQLASLKAGAQIIVGTPGRIIDHIKKGSLKLSDISYLVLDEADEMLRMGFQEDVEYILEKTPKKRQTALFSATMPIAIRKIAQKYLINPKEILIESKTTTGENVHQRFALVRHSDKLELTLRILEVENYDASIIFVRTRIATEILTEKLRNAGFRANAINGDIPQKQREYSIDKLKKGQADILVATDVAARGLDVDRISLVINYDIPLEAESYVHRIGRTGRAGRNGEAILFVTPSEKNLLRNIEKTTRQKISKMLLPTKEQVCKLRLKKIGENILQTVSSKKDNQENLYIEYLKDFSIRNDLDMEKIAGILASMHYGDNFLNPHHIEEPNENSNKKDNRSNRTHNVKNNNKQKFSSSNSRESHIAYKLNIGHSSKVKPVDIIRFFIKSNIKGTNIGYIDIKRDFSLINFYHPITKDQLKNLQNTKINNSIVIIKECRINRR